MTAQLNSAVSAPRVWGYSQRTWHIMVSVLTLGLPCLAYVAGKWWLTLEQAKVVAAASVAFAFVAVAAAFVAAAFVAAAGAVAAGATGDIIWPSIAMAVIVCANANLAVAFIFEEH